MHVALCGDWKRENHAPDDLDDAECWLGRSGQETAQRPRSVALFSDDEANGKSQEEPDASKAFLSCLRF